jgi:hypothetical protein
MPEEQSCPRPPHRPRVTVTPSPASSVPVCPGAARARGRVDVTSTSKTLRWATLVRLAILSQFPSSSGRPR